MNTKTGTIYVLRSLSAAPEIAQARDFIHKIGATSGGVKKRIANAKKDPTYLLADVEIVAEYDLYDMQPLKLENLIHQFFAGARLDIEIKDRFGNPVKPEEWFLAPLQVIDEVIRRIDDGSIIQFVYDAQEAQLKRS